MPFCASQVVRLGEFPGSPQTPGIHPYRVLPPGGRAHFPRTNCSAPGEVGCSLVLGLWSLSEYWSELQCGDLKFRILRQLYQQTSLLGVQGSPHNIRQMDIWIDGQMDRWTERGIDSLASMASMHCNDKLLNRLEYLRSLVKYLFCRCCVIFLVVKFGLQCSVVQCSVELCSVVQCSVKQCYSSGTSLHFTNLLYPTLVQCR